MASQANGKRNKAYKMTKNDVWTMAVLEADALSNITSPLHRLECYNNALLPAIQSVKGSINDALLHDNKNKHCDLLSMLALSFGPYRIFVDSERQFNGILCALHKGMADHYGKPRHVRKKLKIEPVDDDEMLASAMVEQALIVDFDIKQEELAELEQSKREKAEKKRRKVDKIVRDCRVWSANELFVNVPKQPVCEICLAGTNVAECAGVCNRTFHRACVGNAGRCADCSRNASGRIAISRNQMYCIRCAAVYPRDSSCIPAGSRILSSTQLVCPRHDMAVKAVRFKQCSECGRGGRLVSCGTCPISCHAKCLSKDIDPMTFVCMRCKAGVLPLYGEFVWVKYLQFVWWPGKMKRQFSPLDALCLVIFYCNR